MVCDQVNHEQHPLGHHGRSDGTQQDGWGHNASDDSSQLNLSDAWTSSTQLTLLSPPIKACLTPPGTPPIRPMSLSSQLSSSSLPTLSSLPSLTFLSSDNSSPFASEDDCYSSTQDSTPQEVEEAQEASMRDEVRCSTEEKEADVEDGTKDFPENTVLKEYKRGLPVTTG